MNFNLTLIGQSFAFLLFVWFCVRFIWPPVMAALRARREKIAEGLKAAEENQRLLENTRRQAESERETARAEAAEIVRAANERANGIVEEAKQRAREEGEREKHAAAAEIELERTRVREALRAQLSALVIRGTERVLRQEVDGKKHGAVLQELSEEL